MINILFNILPYIIGLGVLIWTLVTIFKTDGLLKYKYNEETDETEEIDNND